MNISPFPGSANEFLAVSYVLTICLNASQVVKFFAVAITMGRYTKNFDSVLPLNFRRSWNTFLLASYLVALLAFGFNLEKISYLVAFTTSFLQLKVSKEHLGYAAGDHLLVSHMVWLSLILLFSSSQTWFNMLLILTACSWLMTYLVSGLCKISKGWLLGDALLKVAASSTCTISNSLHKFLEEHTLITRFIQWLVVVEFIFPFIIFFAPNTLAFASLIMIGVFHAVIWKTLDLPSFAAAYASFIPSMIYAIQYL